MLPGVNTEERNLVSNNRVLVGPGHNPNVASLLVLDEPAPSGSLDTGQRTVELLLEGIVSTPLLLNQLGELAAWWLASASRLGRKVLPEESVVEVSSSVEVEESLSRDSGLDVSLSRRLGNILFGSIEAGNVGGMVLGVVEL